LSTALTIVLVEGAPPPVEAEEAANTAVEDVGTSGAAADVDLAPIVDDLAAVFSALKASFSLAVEV
jgi:hypothetical protein